MIYVVNTLPKGTIVEGTSRRRRTRQLDELQQDFAEGNFTEESLAQLFTDSQHARSSSSQSDRDRIALQMAILYQTWLIDGQTTWMAKAIIFNQDSSLIQKVKTFITWIGTAPEGGFAG